MVIGFVVIFLVFLKLNCFALKSDQEYDLETMLIANNIWK